MVVLRGFRSRFTGCRLEQWLSSKRHCLLPTRLVLNGPSLLTNFNRCGLYLYTSVFLFTTPSRLFSHSKYGEFCGLADREALAPALRLVRRFRRAAGAGLAPESLEPPPRGGEATRLVLESLELLLMRLGRFLPRLDRATTLMSESLDASLPGLRLRGLPRLVDGWGEGLRELKMSDR